MHRELLKSTLRDYRRTWGSGLPAYSPADLAHETRTLQRFEEFVESSPHCFERSHPPGHLTGSALLWCPHTDRVLLTLHRKLGKWLQLGGHADGNPRLHEVALQEAREESGLHELEFLAYAADARPPLPFDLDVHEIPEGPHFHYDVRYLVRADSRQPVKISPESKDLRWVSLKEARDLCPEPSMHRQFDKLTALQ
jgi:8-oxo-dGTP pyrophosphatase MutT (NUDIX family)